jgi:hypothetical protein
MDCGFESPNQEQAHSEWAQSALLHPEDRESLPISQLHWHRLSEDASCSIRGGSTETAATPQRRTTIATLQLDLQDGFADDLVVVRVNGIEVFRKEGVTTKLLLGYADSFQVRVPEGSVDVEVVVPSRNLSRTVSIRISQKSYLGVSIQDGKIEYLERNEPFPYA